MTPEDSGGRPYSPRGGLHIHRPVRDAHPMADTPDLDGLLDAFNAHDLDAIMAFFTDDCVFDAPRGPAPGGRRFAGRRRCVRGSRRGSTGSRTSCGDARHFSSGDRGASEWTIRGTQATGEPIEVRGCDLFEYADGKVRRKDSFWKIVE